MKEKIQFELVWILITAVVIALLILPIHLTIGKAYPFYWDNAFIVIIAVTFIRYIFLMKHHWLAYSKWIKLVFVFVPIPVLFFLLGAFYDFQSFYDEHGMESIMENLNYKRQNQLSLYIRTQIVLFWAAAFIANAMMPFRMIISIWRKMHKGTH